MKPQNDRIAPVQHEERVDHGGDVVAAWMAGETPRALDAFGRAVDAVTIGELLRRTQSTVVQVALTANAPDVLHEFVRLRGRPGVPRTYVHAPDTMANEVSAWGRAAGTEGRVMYRLGTAPPADCVVFGDEAIVFLGPSGKKPRWVLDLGSAQARTLSSTFAWLFWHRATREMLPGDTHPGAAPPGVEPDPIGAQSSFALAAGLLCPHGSAPAHASGADIAVLPEGLEWTGNASTVFVSADATEGASLTALDARARGGATCVSATLDLPATYLSPDRVNLVLGDARLALRLVVDGPLATQLYQAVDDVARRPAWRYHPALRLADASRPVRRGPKLPEESVAAEVVVDDGAIVAPELERTSTARPPLGRPKGLARTWVHRWRVAPPMAPLGARPAALYEAWRQVDTFARGQADQLRRRLACPEADPAGLTDAAAMIRRRRAIESELDEITEAPLSTQPDSAERLLDRLSAQRTAVDELLDAIATARHDENETVRRAQAEASHADRVAGAKRDKEAREQERVSLSTAVDQVRAAHEGANDKTTRKAAVKKLEAATRALTACDQAIEKARPVIDAPFVFTPSPRKAPAKAPPPVTLTVPSEALPDVGHLVEHGGRRFLEIERWSQLDAGRATARQMKADLVAAREQK